MADRALADTSVWIDHLHRRNEKLVDLLLAGGVLEKTKLTGRGLGWMDVSLLASAVDGGLPFWTLDRRLAKAAADVGVAMKA